MSEPISSIVIAFSLIGLTGGFIFAVLFLWNLLSNLLETVAYWRQTGKWDFGTGDGWLFVHEDDLERFRQDCRVREEGAGLGGVSPAVQDYHRALTEEEEEVIDEAVLGAKRDVLTKHPDLLKRLDRSVDENEELAEKLDRDTSSGDYKHEKP